MVARHGSGFKYWSGLVTYFEITNTHALKLLSQTRKEGSTVSSIICDHWRQLKVVVFKYHQGINSAFCL